MKAPDKNRSSKPMAELKERELNISDDSILRTLVGAKDKNIRTIERELDIQIGRDGNGLVLNGQDASVDLAYDLLKQLSDLLKSGETIWPGDLERALKMLSSNRRLKLEELFRDQVKISGRKFKIVPKTFRQKEYIEAIKSHDVVFGIGPAGTGKTFLAMAMGISALVQKDVKRLVLCRPAVEAGEKIGFLPGDMAEKVNPYLRPLYDALHDMVDHDRAQEMIDKGQIEVAPLAFMRGRTLTNAFVILDEAQNTTPIQMKMILTRLGRNSKCVVTGDVTQIDLPRGTRSGLVESQKILKEINGIKTIHFTDEDVIRHPLVSRIVNAYKAYEDKSEK